jgi:imidazolonepropionase-like amidohydrolase
LKDARIITMNGDLVIEKGAIVVRAGRIVQIGPSAQVEIPGDAEVIKLNGKTIMPGLIDSHAHAYLARDLLPQNHWELLANLAFGVTTIKDPSNGGHHGFQYGELTESGKTVGPRVYGAAGLVRGIADLNSYEDAIGAVKSMKLLGGTFVKYHTGYSRQQRQWLFEAARREGLNAAAHYPTDNGNGQLNLTTIADGATTAEHDISEILDLFDDVKTLLVQSGVGVSYAEAPSLGGRYHHAYWSTHQEDPRTRNFLRMDPPKTQWTPSLLPSNGLAPLYPSAEHVVAFLADIDRRGAKVLVGSHGNYDGIGMHWSMWAHARGGMSNLHVLRAATLNGAWGLGLEEDLGSIEVGKLADLLILADNPLEDIRNTLSIESVMKDGVLRESATLDEIWPTRTPLPAWQYQGSAPAPDPH